VKRFLYLLVALCILTMPRGIFAQAEPSVTTEIEPRDVAVGELFTVSLSITVDSSAPSPSDPRLALPEGLKAGPPSISNQTQISLMNGKLSRRSGITATWQVVALREGVFSIQPPSAAWNGRRVQGRPLRVTVHAAGAPGRGRQPAPTPNPFDPFGMIPRLPGFFDRPEPQLTPEPQVDQQLSLDAPLDPKVFLRAIVDQRNPVVGEQVTLNVWMYSREGSVEVTDPHEPVMADFFRRELAPPTPHPESRAVLVGGVPWRAYNLLKVALFPLRAGELEIGPMQATTFVGNRPSGMSGEVRESQPVKLRAVEPSPKGRPVGYQIGDVGIYSLSANVEPRTSEVGGAVAVTITLTGVGNVPSAVRVPVSSSAEWLEPQLRESFDVENGKIHGSRTFAYVVRPKAVGNVDLGEVTLPYWNPDRRIYEVARASLGTIDVTPGKLQAGAKDSAAPSDPWSSLGAPRTELAPYARAREPITDKPWYWLGLCAAPLAVVMGSLGSKGLRRLHSRWTTRRASPERAIDQALSQARDAKKRDDRAAVAGSLDRALHLAIERATGLKARALLVDEIPSALEERTVPADLAAHVRDLLSSIETLRFAPQHALAPGELLDGVAGAVRRLGRLPSAGKR